MPLHTHDISFSLIHWHLYTKIHCSILDFSKCYNSGFLLSFYLNSSYDSLDSHSRINLICGDGCSDNQSYRSYNFLQTQSTPNLLVLKQFKVALDILFGRFWMNQFVTPCLSKLIYYSGEWMKWSSMQCTGRTSKGSGMQEFNVKKKTLDSFPQKDSDDVQLAQKLV
jgi:hypothetical protein